MQIKLYVGNLSYSTTENDLRTLFAQAGVGLLLLGWLYERFDVSAEPIT